MEEREIELEGHKGYLSDIDFIDDNRVLTASGDSFIKMWDIQKEKCVTTFGGHSEDAWALSVHNDKLCLYIFCLIYLPLAFLCFRAI